MTRRLSMFALFLIVAIAAAGVYRMVKSELEVNVYRQRLDTVSQAYQQLVNIYNEVVKKTAVTELLVENGELCVVVRNAGGQIERTTTPYDPSGEIYVDYIVCNGRLWIRRVYDAHTPPSRGLVIDPQLDEIDWSHPSASHGKAVYRTLTDGRWIVTVTGDGSLGLGRAGPTPVPLTVPPPVKDYQQLESKFRTNLERIGPSTVLRKIITSGG